MRRIFSAIALLCALAGQAFAAGTIPIALAQQFDKNGVPLVNCQLFLYQVGTVATPQNAFQDTGLTQALTWPVVCDANGRLPMFYLADGSIHPRLTDSAGVVQFDYPSMLVIGPSSGGGGGSTVDPTTIAATGDIKFRPTSEFVTGWVKLNGQTIGSATSGASGRANADTQNLYIYLWTNCTDAHCPVLTGRGGTAAADFAANKQLTLPDWRSRIPVGLDDMGSTAANRMLSSNVTSGGGDTTTTPGATGGEANHTLVLSQLPAPMPSIAITDPGHTHGIHSNGTNMQLGVGSGTISVADPASGAKATSIGTTDSATTGITAAMANAGGSQAFNVMQPFMLGTWYEKL